MPHLHTERMRKMLDHVVAAEMQRLLVRIEQAFLALVLLEQQFLDHAKIEIEQCRQRADVHDVLDGWRCRGSV